MNNNVKDNNIDNAENKVNATKKGLEKGVSKISTVTVDSCDNPDRNALFHPTRSIWDDTQRIKSFYA